MSVTVYFLNFLKCFLPYKTLKSYLRYFDSILFCLNLFFRQSQMTAVMFATNWILFVVFD